MNILTLQITADNFEAILKGEQKIETRLCDNLRLMNRYFYVDENDEYQFRKIDALRLINGRRRPVPELLVEVVDGGWHDYYNEKNEQLTFEENNEEYPIIGIEYELGKVLEHKNCEKFLK